jgi:hypothetical protein
VAGVPAEQLGRQPWDKDLGRVHEGLQRDRRDAGALGLRGGCAEDQGGEPAMLHPASFTLGGTAVL